jgi:molecular chaperone GrpE
MGTDQIPPTEAGEAAPAETELAALRKDLEAAQTKAAENLDGWQRERATFANYKRRIEKEQADMRVEASVRVLGRFLDVLDDLERALKDKPGDGTALEAALKWAEGVSLIHRKLQTVLDGENVIRIEAIGQPFDPQFHEAITHEDSAEHPSGHVIDVVRPGYRAGDRVVRPALVRVAK